MSRRRDHELAPTLPGQPDLPAVTEAAPTIARVAGEPTEAEPTTRPKLLADVPRPAAATAEFSVAAGCDEPDAWAPPTVRRAGPHVIEDERTASLEPAESPGEEPSPTAVRPLGQLGGAGAIGLVLDYVPTLRGGTGRADAAIAKPAPPRAGEDGLGTVVDDTDTPEEELPPTLPPRLLCGRPGRQSEADRLEQWLGGMLDEPEAAPPATAILGDRAATTAVLDLAALPVLPGSLALGGSWALGHGQAPLTVAPLTAAMPSAPRGWAWPFAPAAPGADEPRDAPLTQALVGGTLGGTLPFIPVLPSEGDLLERWLRGVERPITWKPHGADARPEPTATGPEPTAPGVVVPAAAATVAVSPAVPPVVFEPPDPLRALASVPAAVPEASASVPHESEKPDDLLICLEVYAQVKVAIWDEGVNLIEALARLQIDEMRWRTSEQRRTSLLADQARAGNTELAQRIREAIRQVRDARRGGTGRGEQSDVDLATYVAVRVALEQVDEAAEPGVLAAHGLHRHQWDELRVCWTERARTDPVWARRIRRALGRARRARVDGCGGPRQRRAP
jgi:hypothetical protein